VVLYLLPSEAGYMAGSSIASAMDGSLQRPVFGAMVKGSKCAHYTFSTAECDLLLSISVLLPFG